MPEPDATSTPRRAAPGVKPAHVRDVDERTTRRRRRRRERPRGGEVLPRPLRTGHEDPAARPAARLRRPLAPQRVPRPERRRRRRRRDDAAQRRHGQPRQHRRLEPARRRPARHPRLLRAAGARHARLLRRRHRQLPEQHGAGDPHVLRAAADAAVPGRRLGRGHARAATTRPSRTRPGWTAFVNRLPTRRRPRTRSCGSRPTRRPTGSPPSTAADDRPGEEASSRGSPTSSTSRLRRRAARRRSSSTSARRTGCSARAPRRSAPPTAGRSASRASTASGCPTPRGDRSPASVARRRWTTWSTPSRRGRGRTATRRCSGCSSRS